MSSPPNSSKMDKIEKVKAQADEVKEIMVDNIQHLIHNMETLESLEEKTSDLANNSKMFATSTRTLRRRTYCKNVRINFIITGVLLFILAIIAFSLYLRYK